MVSRSWLPVATCCFALYCLLVFSPASGFSQADEGGALAGAFSGRLVDEEDNPVTDAEITLQGSGYYRTRTDQDGKFTFLDAIKAGEYRLGIKSLRWVGITDYWKMPQIIIDPDKPTKRDFTLKRACRLELTVVDENGAPVKASVYYRPLAAERFRNAGSTTTNDEGISTIGGLAASDGKYLVGVSSKSHSCGHAIIEVSDPGQVVKQEIVLQTGKPVKGRAVCSDGEPPAGWSIYALPTWWNFGSYPSGVKIGEDGTFELPHIGDGRFNLTIFIPTGDGMSESRSVLTDANLLEMDQPIQVTLDYPSPKSMNYLTGTIRWIGKPLKRGVQISGYSAELKHHVSFHLKAGETKFKIGPFPKGTYRIRPEHSELEVLNLRKLKNLNDLDHVRIPNEKPLQLVLRVRGKPHVQGAVVDADTQQPIPSLR